MIFVIIVQTHLLVESGEVILKELFKKKQFKFTFVGIAIVLVSIFIVYFMRTSVASNEYPIEEGDTRIAAVGDSITNGLYVANWPEGNYPNQLDALLGEGFGVVNFGVNNQTAQITADNPYYYTDAFAGSVEFEPELVIFMLGTNDAKNYNWTNEVQFKNQYEELLSYYQELPSVSRIILASPATAFVDPTENVYDSANIQTITQIVEEVAIEQELEYVDVNEMTATRPEWYVDDGIHLNNEGALVLARAFYEQIITEQR